MDDGNRYIPTESKLSIQAALEILSHPYRREILSIYITGDQSSIAIEELIEELQQRHAERGHLHDSREAVTANLYHNHLPKLADCGVLEYDDRGRDIRYNETQILEDLCETIEKYQS